MESNRRRAGDLASAGPGAVNPACTRQLPHQRHRSHHLAPSGLQPRQADPARLRPTDPWAAAGGGFLRAAL